MGTVGHCTALHEHDGRLQSAFQRRSRYIWFLGASECGSELMNALRGKRYAGAQNELWFDVVPEARRSVEISASGCRMIVCQRFSLLPLRFTCTIGIHVLDNNTGQMRSVAAFDRGLNTSSNGATWLLCGDIATPAILAK